MPWHAVCCCCCRFQGHQDIISGIGYLPAPLDYYITSSWDQQLRLWKRPLPGGSSSSSGGGAGVGASSRAGVGSRLEAPGLLPEDSEEGQVVSEYEKAHPLVVPMALSQVCVWAGTALRLSNTRQQGKACPTPSCRELGGLSLTWQQHAACSVSVSIILQDHTSALLQAIGITDGGKPSNAAKRSGGRGGGGRRATREARFSEEGSLSGQEAAADAPGSLGAKLQELGRRLLQVRAFRGTAAVLDCVAPAQS
jgi:hypothetical protein